MMPTLCSVFCSCLHLFALFLQPLGGCLLSPPFLRPPQSHFLPQTMANTRTLFQQSIEFAALPIAQVPVPPRIRLLHATTPAPVARRHPRRQQPDGSRRRHLACRVGRIEARVDRVWCPVAAIRRMPRFDVARFGATKEKAWGGLQRVQMYIRVSVRGGAGGVGIGYGRTFKRRNACTRPPPLHIHTNLFTRHIYSVKSKISFLPTLYTKLVNKHHTMAEPIQSTYYTPLRASSCGPDVGGTTGGSLENLASLTPGIITALPPFSSVVKREWRQVA